MSSSKVQEKPQACNFIKKETLAQVFSCVNFAKLLRTPYILHPEHILQNTLQNILQNTSVGYKRMPVFTQSIFISFRE